MDLRRLRAGEWVTAGSGVLLAVSLFLPWYSRDGMDYSAWEAFALVDLLLLLLALLAVGLLLLTAFQSTAAAGIAADALLTLVAVTVGVVTVIRVLEVPGSIGSGVERAAFAWVGLASVGGVILGTIIAMRDERLSKPGAPTDATGVPLTGEPEIEQFPAPPPGAAGE